MRIYLDLCCFNRPYDDQTQTRIRLETEAKLVLQQKVRDGICQLVWSSILDYENSHNPFEERQIAIQKWRQLASICVMADTDVKSSARSLTMVGISSYDALHVSSAIAARTDLFVTTDDRLLKHLRRVDNLELRATPPGEALALLENWYEN